MTDVACQPEIRIAMKKQSGFALMNVVIAMMLAGILAAYASGKWATSVDESAAEATGRYMITVRSAVIKAMTEYMATLTQEDTSGAPAGTYPVAPAWANFNGNSATISVNDLKTSGFLDDGFPDTPPMGRSVHVTFRRSGTCPGTSCNVNAYVFTCWPISRGKPTGAIVNTTCPVAPANWQFDASLVGAVIMATDGYGGNNSVVPATMRGPMFSINSVDLGIPTTSAGHVAVIAAMNDNLFPQFVRQGDTRHIFLKNNLSVTGQVATDQGVVINTNVVPATACTTPGMYATANNGSMAQCVGNQWFAMTSHKLSAVQTLANGAVVTPPTCPGSNMTAFSYASMQNSDVTMSGSDIKVAGTLTGGITGTGNVSNSGSVSVSGSFNGTTQSTNASSIRVAQSVSIVGGRVVISPASGNARALVMTGCRYL